LLSLTIGFFADFVDRAAASGRGDASGGIGLGVGGKATFAFSTA
jgi:hypothetical protein